MHIPHSKFRWLPQKVNPWLDDPTCWAISFTIGYLKHFLHVLWQANIFDRLKKGTKQILPHNTKSAPGYHAKYVSMHPIFRCYRRSFSCIHVCPNMFLWLKGNLACSKTCKQVVLRSTTAAYDTQNQIWAIWKSTNSINYWMDTNPQAVPALPSDDIGLFGEYKRTHKKKKNFVLLLHACMLCICFLTMLTLITP